MKGHCPLGSPVVNVENVRSGHWLGSVLSVFFSALILFGWQEGLKPVSIIPMVLFHYWWR